MQILKEKMKMMLMQKKKMMMTTMRRRRRKMGKRKTKIERSLREKVDTDVVLYDAWLQLELTSRS